VLCDSGYVAGCPHPCWLHAAGSSLRRNSEVELAVTEFRLKNLLQQCTLVQAAISFVPRLRLSRALKQLKILLEIDALGLS
jgi:hypothetical protein